jgi:hypothetical protein
LPTEDNFTPKLYSIKDKADYYYAKRICPDINRKSIFKKLLDIDRSSAWSTQLSLGDFMAQSSLFLGSGECLRIERYLSEICQIYNDQ